MRRPFAPVALLVLAVLAGCAPGGGSTPSPTESESPTPSGTASPAPSPTPSPSETVISSTTTHDWGRPLQGSPYSTQHTVTPPPLPCLVSVATGRHPDGNPDYDQISFRFDTGFPSYDVEYVSSIEHEGSGEPVDVPDADSILRVTFRQAQAHRDDGSSCTVSAPPTRLDLPSIASWVPAGDFEGVLVYGLGIHHGSGQDDPHPRVRIVEVERAEPGGTVHVVAVQVTTPEHED